MRSTKASSGARQQCAAVGRLWTLAQDDRPRRGRDRCISARDRRQSLAGRSVVELVRPQDGPVRRQRRSDDGTALRGELADKDRYYIHFALGKAFEQRGEHETSFGHYAEGDRTASKPARLRPRSTSPICNGGQAHLFIRLLRRASGSRRCQSRPDIHPRHEPRRIDLDRTDIVEPPAGRRDDGAAQCRGDRDRPVGRINGAGSTPSRRSDPARFADLGARIYHATPAATGKPSARFRRQDAEQLGARAANPPDLPNARIIDARRHPLAC